MALKTVPYSDAGALFRLGKVSITSAALDALAAASMRPQDLLGRHAAGDWGHVHPEAREANESDLLKTEGAFTSCYVLGGTGEEVWVTTHWSRTWTIIMLPFE
jgi:hypothetical protein